MRIRVTLEKEDILRLVKEHVERSGLKPIEGQPIKYKGALQAEFVVDVEDRPAAPLPTSKVPTSTRKDAPEDDGRSIDEILAQSKRIEKEREAEVVLKRKLGAMEFLEFPRGGK